MESENPLLTVAYLVGSGIIISVRGSLALEVGVITIFKSMKQKQKLLATVKHVLCVVRCEVARHCAALNDLDNSDYNNLRNKMLC